MSTQLHLVEPLQSRFPTIIRDTRDIGWSLREGRMPAAALAAHAQELCRLLGELPLPPAPGRRWNNLMSQLAAMTRLCKI